MYNISCYNENPIVYISSAYFTFQSLIIKKLDNLGKKIYITKVSIKCHFFKNFGKTVNLSFNRSTGVNSLCSIYFTKDAKKNFHQIHLRCVKPPQLTEMAF